MEDADADTNDAEALISGDDAKIFRGSFTRLPSQMPRHLSYEATYPLIHVVFIHSYISYTQAPLSQHSHI